VQSGQVPKAAICHMMMQFNIMSFDIRAASNQRIMCLLFNQI
jgi:hypothetical protein